MSKLVVMPKLGLTMVEGKVLRWHKKEGEDVKKGEIIFQVETDKLTNNVVSDQDGVVRKIFVHEGQSVPVSAPIAVIAEADEDISSLIAGVPEKANITDVRIKEIEQESCKAKPIARKKGEYIRATPYAKKLANEKSIDMADIMGTGEEGRILAKDILNYEPEKKIKISPTAAKMAKDLGVDISAIDSSGRIMKSDILNAINVTSGEAEERTRVVEASNMRRIIAERMHESWTISPRVTYNLEVDITNMKLFRESLKEDFVKAGIKLSYNHILTKILAKTLLEYPYLNGSYSEDKIILHEYVNMGLAIDVEGGLLVPNIKDVQNKSLLEISVETEKIIKATREGSLSPDYLEGGTFTLSNMGMFGIDSFSPIINQPEIAILGVNRMVDKPVVVDGEIVIKTMMNLSLTSDHRLVDGAMAARFLRRTKEIIENPYLLLM